MKVFTTTQIAALDRFTIENEPVSDIDLMERASLQIATWIVKKFDNNNRIAVFAGPGNNGGDALAVSRLLADQNYMIDLYIPQISRGLSASDEINLKRLQDQGMVKIKHFAESDQMPVLQSCQLLIDGLFGSGLSRPLSGFSSLIVKHINNSGLTVISIDIPSGLMGEDNFVNDYESIIKVDYT